MSSDAGNQGDFAEELRDQMFQDRKELLKELDKSIKAASSKGLITAGDAATTLADVMGTISAARSLTKKVFGFEEGFHENVKMERNLFIRRMRQQHVQRVSKKPKPNQVEAVTDATNAD